MSYPSDREDLLEAFQRARTELKLCPNRLWAVAGENLPKLLPDFKKIPSKQKRRGAYSDEDDHQSCTFDFCEYSQRDFTAVQQRHECKDANCMQLRGLFPRDVLNYAASNEKSTVWKLSGDAMLDPPRSYMAISHVWSDGTGAGAWQDGRVNECLYAYFRGIAEQFSCDGIWWDTICIPREKAARNKAIRNIQNNYQDAKITLVHDCFLRNWRWDRETACFAILMSPWFSRGWTALELAKSRKVKVIFKGRSGPIIKDLDEEILAKDGEPDGPRKEASRIIQSLRKDITSLNDLLTVLGPRYTSWPKDLAIISALLVSVAPEEKQQTVYRTILRKIGWLSHGHLFHNSATMSEDFRWCPTSLFNMPVDSSSSPRLTIHDDGVHGWWRFKKVDETTEAKCSWVGSHPLIRRILEKSLKYRQCALLAKCGTGPVREALLVNKIQGSHYAYVGALFFRQDYTGHWTEAEVVISHLGFAKEEEVESGSSESLDHNYLSDKADFTSQRDDSGKTSSSDIEIFRRAIWRGDWMTVARLSGKSEVYIPDSLGWSPLHFAAERGDSAMVGLLNSNLCSHSGVNFRSKDGRTALHRAVWAGSPSTVEVLLHDQIDPLIVDNDGNLALHIAAQMGFKPMINILEKYTSLSATGCNKLTALHYAIINRHPTMASLLLERGAKITAREAKLGWTPLHCAACVGDEKVVEKLIAMGAKVDSKDRRAGWTPLHLAAINRHSRVMQLLMDNYGDSEDEDDYGWTPKRFSRVAARLENLDLQRDANTNSDTPRNNIRWTMLHCMAINSPDDLLKFLVKKRGRTVSYGQDKDWSPLLYAAKKGLRAPTKWLLYESHDLEQRDSSGLTALSLAAKEGHTFIVDLLLHSGANVDAKDEDYCTPISWAARSGHIGVVEILLEKRARIMEWNMARLPPLVWAARMGHVAIVEMLLGRGANIEGWSVRGLNDPEYAYARDKEKRQLKDFGQLKDSDSDDKNYESDTSSGNESESDYDYGLSPLSWAANMGHEAVVELLIRRGADIDGRDIREHDHDVLAPIECAARLGHLKIIELLLSKGASVEGNNSDELDSRMTPLGWAARMGNLSVVKALLSHGANIEREGCREKEEESFGIMMPLSWAAKMGHEGVVDFLLKKGADIEGGIDHPERDEGFTPLQWAAHMGHANIVKLLVQRGAKVEGVAGKGIDECELTPLALAAGKGHGAIVEFLLQSGANIEGLMTQDEWDMTPLGQAALGEHLTIVQLLLRKGANKETLTQLRRTEQEEKMAEKEKDRMDYPTHQMGKPRPRSFESLSDSSDDARAH